MPEKTKTRRTRARLDTIWVMFEQVEGTAVTPNGAHAKLDVPRKAFLNQADAEQVVGLADDLFADHNLVVRAIEVWKPR